MRPAMNDLATWTFPSDSRAFWRTTATRIAAIAAVVVGASACGGGGGQVIEPAATPAAAPKEAPKTPDAYRDFGGETVALGVKHRLRTRPIGIKELNIVVELVKTQWTTRELPNGKEVKDGTADLLIKKGEKSRRLRLDEGESRVIYGAKISVEGAGEEYDKSRLDYMPWVDIVVSKPE